MPKKKNDGSKVVLALTGGIGSGKSTVLKMFQQQGAVVVDCDAIVHQLLKTHQGLLKKIRSQFGTSVFDSRGQLDRKKLGELVFKSKKKRKNLEKLVHPLIRKEIYQQLQYVKEGVVIVDIPLYFESGWENRIRPVIVVDSKEAVRFQRLRKKGFIKEDIQRRMNAQWPLPKKVKKADFVVDNNGRITDTKKQIHQIWKDLINKERGTNGIRT